MIDQLQLTRTGFRKLNLHNGFDNVGERNVVHRPIRAGPDHQPEDTVGHPGDPARQHRTVAQRELDLAGRLPTQASQLYGTNLVNLLKLLTPDKDGKLVLDFDDVVQRGVTVVRDGEITWPPPPVQVSAAPATAPAATPAVSQAKKPMSTQRRLGTAFTAAAVLFVLIAISPAALQVHLTVFALAIVIGYYVIGHVHHALHTPLMSVTNAISGIIVVGALLQIGHGDPAITTLATVAILLASINVFGGFAVTRRMLAMFSRS